jgi:ring-1,2-phenylacetyl-CoA epoxidase subunit PaaD
VVADLVRSVPDPELPFLTIEDLGILRSVSVDGDVVHVVITPTYSGCPAMDEIRADIAAAVAQSGLTAEVETVLSPAWTTDWISERGRAALAANGIAPPTAVRGPVLVELSGPQHALTRSGADSLRGVGCPQCGSSDTEELSRFGSTACKSMWRCRSCREPFDHFKWH